MTSVPLSSLWCELMAVQFICGYSLNCRPNSEVSSSSSSRFSSIININCNALYVLVRLQIYANTWQWRWCSWPLGVCSRTRTLALINNHDILIIQQSERWDWDFELEMIWDMWSCIITFTLAVAIKIYYLAAFMLKYISRWCFHSLLSKLLYSWQFSVLFLK